ncbi:MAG: RNA methyltransferase [Bacteroidia bacterium]|nr:RNA methyltransferase [Bacteroidia bacterium]
MEDNRKLKNEELNRLSFFDFKNIEKFPIIIILDNVRSALNVGSVFRTADAFAIDEIYLCGITACPPNKEIHKSALGSTDSVNWKHYTTTEGCILQLKQKGYTIYAVEQAEKKTYLNDWKISANQKIALIFGNEVDGVEQTIIDQCHKVIEIPQYGTKHSLNVAVSAGVVLWEVVKQFLSK